MHETGAWDRKRLERAAHATAARHEGVWVWYAGAEGAEVVEERIGLGAGDVVSAPDWGFGSAGTSEGVCACDRCRGFLGAG